MRNPDRKQRISNLLSQAVACENVHMRQTIIADIAILLDKCEDDAGPAFRAGKHLMTILEKLEKVQDGCFAIEKETIGGEPHYEARFDIGGEGIFNVASNPLKALEVLAT